MDFRESAKSIRDDSVRSMLVEDVNAVIRYRQTANPITESELDRLGPVHDRDGEPLSTSELLSLIDPDRDFIFTKHGINLLINRYLFDKEPIQLGLMRIAKQLAKGRTALFKLFYHMLSCGFVHVSSIIAAADHVQCSSIYSGEACRLMVAKDGYDHKLISQIEKISEIISLGVGVGLGVSNLPMSGKRERGRIRSGFASLIERLNASNFVFLHERKPKIALYLHVHNDTISHALDLKSPNRIRKINNVFIGLMIPNYFMECVNANAPWHLFPGDLTLDGVNLADLWGDDYVKHYKRCVELGLYTRSINACELMYDILQSLVESGSPYIIWSDNLNEYNNHKAHGTIKTLNLCAEITNYSDSEHDSSCTLLSCNMAMYKDFPSVQAIMRETLYEEFGVTRVHDSFDMPELAEYAFVVGYLGTLMLNSMMGDSRERREIGLNPLGVYDMALIANESPSQVCATISEALYRGAVTASCDEFARYKTKCAFFDRSEFSRGSPQFVLRGVEPQSDWGELRERMKRGMSNSMLTSQAPTASTSLLTGVTESVIIPISHFLAHESENGRNEQISYGLMYRLLSQPGIAVPLDNGVESQIAMYEASLPYVDHSQSVMLSLDLNTNAIYRALVLTYKAKMKTGLYYAVFRQANQTITSGRMNECVNCTL